MGRIVMPCNSFIIRRKSVYMQRKSHRIAQQCNKVYFVFTIVCLYWEARDGIVVRTSAWHACVLCPETNIPRSIRHRIFGVKIRLSTLGIMYPSRPGEHVKWSFRLSLGCQRTTEDVKHLAPTTQCQTRQVGQMTVSEKDGLSEIS